VPPTHVSPSPSDVKHSELNTAANVFVPGATTAAVGEAASATAVLAAAAAAAASKTHVSTPLPADNMSAQQAPLPAAPAGSSLSGQQ